MVATSAATKRAPLLAGLVLTGLMLAAPCWAQSEGMTGADVAVPVEPAAAAAPAVPPAVPKAAADKTAAVKKKEVLPWENAPIAPLIDAPEPPPADPAVAAAAAQCSGLFEAACRDLKTCAWVADVALPDGSFVPSRCLARPPAPPKTAKKKPPQKPKQTEAAPAAEAAPATKAPAVKEAVTRAEDVGAQPAAPKAEKAKANVADKPVKKAAEPAKEANAAPPPEPAVTKVAPPVTGQKSEPAQAPIVQSPIVVSPPPAKKADAKPEGEAKMPSFSAISPVMPGKQDAVVVTVPPRE